MKRIRLLIVDDQTLIRRGLVQLLADDERLDVVGEAADGATALRLAAQLQPQVLLLDINLGGRDGLDVLRQLRQQQPRLGVIMLTVYSETQFALRALRAGAHAYLNKGCHPDELLQAIERVAAGQLHISPAVAELMAHDVRQGHGRPLHEQLSDREMQVLQLLTGGHSVSTIATQLHLSANTISTYRARLLTKLGLGNTAELVRYALQHQLAPEYDVSAPRAPR